MSHIIDENDISDLKLAAIGKLYVARTHQPDEVVPLQKAVEVLEEYAESLERLIRGGK